MPTVVPRAALHGVGIAKTSDHTVHQEIEAPRRACQGLRPDVVELEGCRSLPVADLPDIAFGHGGFWQDQGWLGDLDNHFQTRIIIVGVSVSVDPSAGRNLDYESPLRVVYGQHTKHLYLGSRCENQLRLFWWYQGRTFLGRDL